MIFASDLTWIILLPVIGALAAMVTPKNIARWLALGFTAATFVLSLVIFFRIALNGYNFGDLNHLPDSINLTWISFRTGNIQFNINYFLGVDGLSLPLVILNALMTMLAVIGGWEKMRVKEYMALLLLLEAGVMGVFLSLDLLLFFLFWEVELAPMFLLIGIWGADVIKHGMPGRIYSAWKFLLYTFFGSVFMLAGILLLYFNFPNTHPPAGMPYTASMQYFSMPALPEWDGSDSVDWCHDKPATAHLLVDLPGFCHQNTHVPIPYLAARCAHRCANGSQRDPGRNSAQDGSIWTDPCLPEALATGCA